MSLSGETRRHDLESGERAGDAASGRTGGGTTDCFQATAGARLAEHTLACIGDGIIRTDAAGRVNFMNAVAEHLTGWSSSDAVGCDLSEIYNVISEAHRSPRHNVVEQCLAEAKSFSPPGLFALKSRDGSEYTIRDTISPVVDPDYGICGVVVVFRDLTHMRTAERRLVFQASHDPLTSLLNRANFERYLEAAVESARSRGTCHSLLHLELMELTLINDCYGRVAGDELLRQVAVFLVREVGGDAVLGRVGGADFHILREQESLVDAAELAQELGRRLAAFRFSWGGQHFEVGFHMGVIGIDGEPAQVAQVLQAADTASHLARQRGRNKIYVFDPSQDDAPEHRSRLNWLQQIRRALAEDGFQLYQQQIEPLDGGAPMHEILVRMRDQDGELVSPDRFIPLAESLDMAPLLDHWVIRKSLETLAAAPVLGDRQVTLNLSGQSLGDENFLQGLAEMVDASPVPAERLFFEITETHAVANLSRALDFMGVLRDMGCRFVLDDFGTGFSSFGYLKNLPVDILKIDGQFVRDIDQDPIARAMVASINEIAHLMGLQTIAEWVEDQAALDIVTDMGVDYVQGFYLHRPKPLAP